MNISLTFTTFDQAFVNPFCICRPKMRLWISHFCLWISNLCWWIVFLHTQSFETNFPPISAKIYSCHSVIFGNHVGLLMTTFPHGFQSKSMMVCLMRCFFNEQRNVRCILYHHHHHVIVIQLVCVSLLVQLSSLFFVYSVKRVKVTKHFTSY